MRKSTLRLRLYVTLAVGAALVLTAALLGGARGQSATQSYLAALRAKGEKLSYAELIRSRPRGSGLALTAITNNAPFLNSSLIEPANLDYTDNRQPGRVSVVWRQPAPNPAATLGKPITWAQFNEAIRQVQPHLREIREVLKSASPEWEIGAKMTPRGPVPFFIAIRGATQWLGGAAMSELQQGHLEEALEDLEALASLANANRSGLTPASELIRVEICGFGLSATWQALQAPGWSGTQLERMQSAWASLDLLAGVEEGLVGWRASAIQMWDAARKSSGQQLRAFIIGTPVGRPPPARTWSTLAEECRDYVLVQSFRLTNMDRDEVFCLQAMQESLEAIRAVQRGQPWVFQSYTTNALALKLNVGPTKKFRHLVSALLTPNSTRVIQTAMRSETLRQMTLAAIAIRRYQARHQAPPPNLEALSPEFLPQPTRDPMSGKALLYRPATNGDWLLYSTGEDATDNGGDPTPKAGAKPGLWAGRDAVWPKAAE